MSSSDEISDSGTPPEILKIAQESTANLLPEKSRQKYEQTYSQFMEWRKDKNINSFSENILLAYFGELSNKYKSSTLWTTYSKLRSTLLIHHNKNIEKYSKLRAFLKRKSDGYRAKKAKIFTADEIKTFIYEAPDEKHLATKVALIMGIMGACRANELYSMKLEDIQDITSAYLVTIPNTKTKIIRKFTVTGNLYNICKKYVNSRAKPCLANLIPFFLCYRNGKCISQRIGQNTISQMGKIIAKYLRLPNPELYSGHSFRRSSATLLVDAGGDIVALKRHGGWKSTSVAEGYIDESMANKMDTANKILGSVNNEPNEENTMDKIRDQPSCSSSNSNTFLNYTSEMSNKSIQPSAVQFFNCANVSHITVNFNSNK